ncbi:MAG: hypothetical protein NTX25_10060 [Proteobacteria bacterium]|nr:hypothetical protein [Pseudomonadota bacterium]
MTEATHEKHSSWKNVESLDGARELVDLGVLLMWKDFKQLQKVLDDNQLKELVRYCAARLSERVENRLPEEILIETLLIIFANCENEEILLVFLQEILQQPNRLESCTILIELAITVEVSDSEHAEETFAIAVALICELGNMVNQFQLANPGEASVSALRLLDRISTYLLSVSNSNDNCIRLSLLHYFGTVEKGKAVKVGFNRIMGRFGHTVLEHLFTLLFNKKTEAVALQFLLENIPHVLEADAHAQTILQETWKHYLLKKPERFSLFIQTLSAHLLSLPDDDVRNCRKTFLQHLALLLKKVAEVDHRELGREILSAMASFAGEPFFKDLVPMIVRDLTIRESFRILLGKIANSRDAEAVLDGSNSFRSSKRGRKPSFAKSGYTPVIYQIKFLGTQQIAKAS